MTEKGCVMASSDRAFGISSRFRSPMTLHRHQDAERHLDIRAGSMIPWDATIAGKIKRTVGAE